MASQRRCCGSTSITFLFALAAAGVTVLGCASNTGTQPRDMSVSGHEAAAEAEERKAASEPCLSPDKPGQAGP